MNKYAKFRTESNGIEVYKAFVKCPALLLNEPVPQAALDYVHGKRFDEEGNEAPHDARTLAEFALSAVDAGDGDVLITLGAQIAPTYRVHPVNIQDLMAWEMYLAPYGYPADTWLTLEEYTAALPQEAEQ